MIIMTRGAPVPEFSGKNGWTWLKKIYNTWSESEGENYDFPPSMVFQANGGGLPLPFFQAASPHFSLFVGFTLHCWQWPLPSALHTTLCRHRHASLGIYVHANLLNDLPSFPNSYHGSFQKTWKSITALTACTLFYPFLMSISETLYLLYTHLDR